MGIVENKVSVRFKAGFRNFLLILTTAILLVVSVIGWTYAGRSVEEQRQKEFNDAVDITTEKVMDVVMGITERLYDLRGFVSSMNIDDGMWNKFISSAGYEKRYPGIFTFAYAPLVQRTNLETFVNQVRKDEAGTEYKNYSVFPTSQNGELIPIEFLSSTDPDLKSLLGFDVATSQNQVPAITMAVAGGTPVVTDLLHLGNLVSGSTKTGYEFLLPVYSKVDIESYPMSERNKYFTGFVAIWIFPQGLVSYLDVGATMVARGVSFTAFDGENKLFTIGETGGDLKETKVVKVLNKDLRFEFTGNRQKLLIPFTENLPWIAAGVLLILNLMWLATVGAIMSSRREAERLAIEATKDLRKFKQGVEGVTDLVIITDPDGIISYANKAAEKITGFRRVSLLGKTPALWGKQMDSSFYKKFWKTIKTDKKPFWGEVTNIKKTGELYEAEINVSPILDDSGNLLFFVGIERDLSKIKAVDRMKTEFISLASHQLRTPLSAVKWFGKMLVSGEAGKLSHTQKDYVEKINESNEREIQLVNSLLNVSRIESGKILIVPKLTDLTKVISNVITDFKMEMGETNTKIRVIMDKKIPLVYLDEDLIRHVYANLISNAIRYTMAGGNIIIKVYQSKNYLMTEVKDNGIGIPKEEQKRIFEKFFRASNALKKETDGTGLGLFLSKTIVESSGGKMGFRSSEGVGSTIWFSLPIRPKEKD